MANVGVVGVGKWGKNHARVLNELGALRAVCDKDVHLASDAANKYEVKSYFSLDEMLQNEKLDACVVCTPVHTHYTVARKIIERGINIFVEKPLSTCVKDCYELKMLAEKKNVILTCGYIERFNPAIRETKKFIYDKKYGDLLMIEFHRENRIPLHVNDVGIIFDTSVHDIDAALFLFGSIPEVVYARLGKNRHSQEDFATIMLGFSNQKTAIISSNWITPKKVRTFSAVCTEGLIWGDFFSQEIRIDNNESTIVPRRQYQEPLFMELKNFLDVIDGKDMLVVTAEDATNVTRVAQAAILSNNLRKPVDVRDINIEA